MKAYYTALPVIGNSGTLNHKDYSIIAITHLLYKRYHPA